MITFIILITLPLLAVGCKEETPEDQPSLNVQEESNADDAVLKEREGDLPQSPKSPPPLKDPSLIRGAGPEILSLLPPDIDQDVDGLADRAIEGHPEIPVDNCAPYYNPEQEDENGNGVGDACE